MAYPQSGQFPAYPQYPGGSGMPAKPPMPQTVQNAFYLMIAGAVLEVVSIIASVGSTSSIRNTVRTKNPDFTTTQVDNAVHIAVAFAVVSVLIGAGLWVWMAFMNRAGKNWARITGTVFFGISCISIIGVLASSGSSGALSAQSASGFSVALGVVQWLVGLATVILLWNKQSGPYFKPEPFTGVGGPGYPYPYGQPPAGQQPPPGDQPSNPWGDPNQSG
jgi:hypothetical protein